MRGCSYTRRGCRRFIVIVGSVLMLVSATAVQNTAAQNVDDIASINVLKPADTSSPRDTLRSFLVFSDALNKERARRGSLEARHLFFRGAAETIDFGPTVYARSVTEKIQRILLLKEVLDRIELPPFEEIPGNEEVADGDIDEWTIPGSRIRIIRKTEGPQAGEFLFSAPTISRINIIYRRIKHIPYNPGESGFYEDWVRDPPPAGAAAREVVVLLQGLDTSSPRATLQSFLESMNETYRIVTAAEAALSSSPPEMTIEEAREAERQAQSFFARASAALDVSEVPVAQRSDAAQEAALMLKEILDRMRLPPIESVPDAEAVAAASVTPFRWEFPGADMTIAESLDPEQSGRFLFDPQTVAGLADAYERVKHLPYYTVSPTMSVEYRSPAPSPGFYENYISTPGRLVPSAHILGRIVQKLPDGFLTLQAGQTRWQWIGLGLVSVVTLVGGYLVFQLISVVTRGWEGPLGGWLKVLPPVLVALGVQWATKVIDGDLNVTGAVLSAVRFIGGAIALFLIAWAIWRAFMAIAVTITASPRISDSGVDASLVRITSGLVALVVALAVIVTGLRDLGVDAVPLIAGLGVGGLAGALAIRPTLENLIGGIVLFTDKPIRVGDFCSFGGMTGTVENIGVRSTQIRGLDRTLISVPNAKFADMELINWANCDSMLITATIGLRYETEDDQLRHVLVKIREMLHAHPKIQRDTVRVRFAGYGASSLDVSIRVYALTREWNEFHAIKEDVFLRIKSIVRASGTGFAFPSQTLYMSRDDGVDAERAKEAATEVESWRRTGNLPFPRLRGRQMDELEGTLDYPPQGSTEAAEPLSTPEAAEPLSAPEGSEPLSAPGRPGDTDESRS